MTEDQKKALIVGGGVAVIALAIWYASRGNGVVISGTPSGQTAPGYTTFNIPPPAGPSSYQGSPVTIGSPPSPVMGGCCSGNDGCFTAGQQNTGNAPTSLGQLFSLYAKSNPAFNNAFNSNVSAYTLPTATIMAQTSPPPMPPTNVVF